MHCKGTPIQVTKNAKVKTVRHAMGLSLNAALTARLLECPCETLLFFCRGSCTERLGWKERVQLLLGHNSRRHECETCWRLSHL